MAAQAVITHAAGSTVVPSAARAVVTRASGAVSASSQAARAVITRAAGSTVLPGALGLTVAAPVGVEPYETFLLDASTVTGAPTTWRFTQIDNGPRAVMSGTGASRIVKAPAVVNGTTMQFQVVVSKAGLADVSATVSVIQRPAIRLVWSATAKAWVAEERYIWTAKPPISQPPVNNTGGTVVTPPVSPSGQALPVGAVAAVTGGTFQDVVACDFSTPVALGDFRTLTSGDTGLLDPATPAGAAYGELWKTKTDLSVTGNGKYSAQRTMSVANSLLTVWFHVDPVNGPLGSAVKPRFPASSGNRDQQVYGASEWRFRARGITSQNWGGVFFWISSLPGRWPIDGELDWVEKTGSDNIGGFHHFANAAGGQQQFSAAGQLWTDWHTCRTEWMPGRVRYLLDGAVVLDTTNQVGANSMGVLFQGCTTGGVPPAGTEQFIDIDWYRVQKLVP